jgi:hypothetical protein
MPGPTTEPISALPSKATFDDLDQIPIVDSVTNQTKRVSKSTLAASLASPFSGWNEIPYSVIYQGNNGNKEFTIQASGVDLTSTFAVGSKFRVTRGTTPSTSCMAFVAASSQYASKATPSGITFTSAYTCEAWVYFNSYTGNAQYIVSRIDGAGTSGGWSFDVTATGQVEIYYGTGSSFTNFVSYQSIPLKRWVHIAGVVSSVSGKTGAIYINGNLAPSLSTVTAATTLTQASVDLRLGTAATTPANKYFDGYMTEVRVWSVAQTASAIQANMGLSLTTATNLVANFPGASNFNDVSGNANNLTSSGGAIATQAANPFKAIEYAVITKMAYSAPNTNLTLFTGTDCVIPNMTLASPGYSIQENPFGFPNGSHKWVVDTIIRSSENINISSAASWSGGNASQNALSIPTGAWEYGMDVAIIEYSTVSGTRNLITALAPATPTTLPPGNVPSGRVFSGSSTSSVASIFSKRETSLTALTTFRLYGYLVTATGSEAWQIDGQEVECRLFAQCTYI